MTAPELMSPGTYLRKRREARGVAVEDLAAQLAGLPWRIRPPESDDVTRLVARIEDAEADRDNLSVLQAALLLNVFPFDIEVYEQLQLHFHARRAPHLVRGLPVPRVCRDCACSQRDGCCTDRGTCAWAPKADGSDPDLCTACERAARLEAELASAPDPFATYAPAGQAAELNPASAFVAEREMAYTERNVRP